MKPTIDIDVIIKLVKEQEPEREDIILSLQNCNEGKWTSKAYYSFVISDNKPNQLGSNWQHSECIEIEDYFGGNIVLDILKDDKIGGIEFLELI